MTVELRKEAEQAGRGICLAGGLVGARLEPQPGFPGGDTSLSRGANQ